MAIKHIDALVMRSHDLARAVAFYRAIGLPLEEERHGDGPLHYACELGPVHIALYPATTTGQAPDRLHGGASMIGFQVDSIEDAFADGRAVELNCAHF